MRRQRRLDLERRHIHARHFQHVVGAAAADVIAIGVLDIFVARARPFAQEGRARLLAIVPIHDRSCRPAHIELAHLALFDLIAVLADQLDFVAGHRLAGGAVFGRARRVGQINMQHLGGAEPVGNVDAVALLPGARDFLRQRFAGGNAAADFHLGALRCVRAGQERGVESRHREEHRDRMFAQQRGDAVRRRPVAQQHRGGANC